MAKKKPPQSLDTIPDNVKPLLQQSIDKFSGLFGINKQTFVDILDKGNVALSPDTSQSELDNFVSGLMNDVVKDVQANGQFSVNGRVYKTQEILSGKPSKNYEQTFNKNYVNPDNKPFDIQDFNPINPQTGLPDESTTRVKSDYGLAKNSAGTVSWDDLLGQFKSQPLIGLMFIIFLIGSVFALQKLVKDGKSPFKGLSTNIKDTGRFIGSAKNLTVNSFNYIKGKFKK